MPLAWGQEEGGSGMPGGELSFPLELPHPCAHSHMWAAGKARVFSSP